MKKWIHKNTFLKVEHKHYYNPSAKKEEHYSIITFSEEGFGIVVPITSDNKVVFIKQYRPAAKKFVLNLPAGRFDNLKAFSQKVKRMKKELEEETGYSTRISNFQKIGEVFLAPARITDKCMIFVAKNVYKTKRGRKLESAEKGSKVILIDFKKAIEMIKDNEIKCMPSIMAILLVKEKLNL